MQLCKNRKINNFEKRLDFLSRIVYNSWAIENPADADYHLTTRRVVRVAEGAALEMLCTFSGTEGSNPSLYAIEKQGIIRCPAFLYRSALSAGFEGDRTKM